jgi:hypothetical protein
LVGHRRPDLSNRFPRQTRWLQQDEIAWPEKAQATEKRNSGVIVVVLLRIDARREQVSGEIAMAHLK